MSKKRKRVMSPFVWVRSEKSVKHDLVSSTSGSSGKLGVFPAELRQLDAIGEGIHLEFFRAVWCPQSMGNSRQGSGNVVLPASWQAGRSSAKGRWSKERSFFWHRFHQGNGSSPSQREENPQQASSVGHHPQSWLWSHDGGWQLLITSINSWKTMERKLSSPRNAKHVKAPPTGQDFEECCWKSAMSISFVAVW